jgi:uncharacterized membrane protein YdjX (TVP38/TMEM64 family)
MLAERTKRILLAIGIGLVLTGLVLVVLTWGRPLWTLFRSPERIHQLVSSWGVWAPLGMIAIQVIQVVVAPLPGNVAAIVSGYVFGLGTGLALCLIGILLGSTVDWLLARLLGRRLLRLFIPEPTIKRFDAFILTRGPFYLLLLLLVPNPIGDWLYYLAGLTAIPLPVFALLVLAGRLPSNLFETFIGVQVARLGSQAYRLTPWQWALLVAGVVAIALAYYLNRRRIERFFARFTRIPR